MDPRTAPDLPLLGRAPRIFYAVFRTAKRPEADMVWVAHKSISNKPPNLEWLAY